MGKPITNDVKQQIIQEIQSGNKKVGDLVKQFGVGRSSIQRIKSSLGETNSVTTEAVRDDLSEVGSLNDFLNDLKNEPVITTRPPPPPSSPVQQQHPQQQFSQPAFDLGFDEKFLEMMDSVEKMGSSESVQKPVIQSKPPRKIMVDRLTDKDYQSKQNVIGQVKRYLSEFENELFNIHQGDVFLFTHRLQELDLDQLKILLSNIEFELNNKQVTSVFNKTFFITISQVEMLSINYGYNVKGLTQHLEQDQSVKQALRELSCKYDITQYTSPEVRLALAVVMTAYGLYSQNTLSAKMNDFLNEPVSPDLDERFKDL